MAEKTHEVARIDELEGADGWSPIRQRLDIRAFGINAWTAHEAEVSVIPEHDEEPSGHEELYLVVSGRATFTVSGEELDAPAGTIVFVRDPLTRRGAVAREPGTTVLAVGGKPGEAFKPRGWETNAQVLPLFDRGEYAEVKRILTEALDLYEDRSGLLYNIACAEAQLGETDAALEHLQAALDERPSFAANARDDSDFAPLRDDPRFNELVGSP